MESTKRALNVIAKDIKEHWANVSRDAALYLKAMAEVESIDDHYGVETGYSIVLYFLANAHGWRGEDARRIKAELKKLACWKA